MNSFGHFVVGALIMVLFLRPRSAQAFGWSALSGGLLGMLPDVDMSFAINGYAEHGCSPSLCTMPLGNLQSPTHNIYFTIAVVAVIAVVAWFFFHVSLKTTALLAGAAFLIIWSHWAVFDYRFVAIRDALMGLPGFSGYADGCGRLTSTLIGLLALGGLMLYWARVPETAGGVFREEPVAPISRSISPRPRRERR